MMTKSIFSLLLIAVVGACTGLPGSPLYSYDVLIRGAQVYDGTDSVPRAVTVAIAGGRIATMDADDDATAALVVNATGKVVIPGFIDPHTHALADLLHAQKNSNINYQTQGVSTVVVGNDGDGITDRANKFATLGTQGIGTNMAFFAGHGAARKAVMGMSDRPASSEELEAMKTYVRNEMGAGALGLSTGLYYAPGSFARTDEIVALTRVAAQFGGLYETHLRDEGSYSIGLLAAVDEAIQIGQQANCPVHISHLKALGPDVWGESTKVIERINQARSDQIDVTANQYPWRASGTRFSNALLPRWIMADSKAAMKKRLIDPSLQNRLTQEMTINLARRGGSSAMLVTGANSPYQGFNLAQIAKKMHTTPLKAAVQLVLDGDPSIASFIMADDDIRAFSQQTWVMTGSDGSSGHPRKYATYPKAYSDLVINAKTHSFAQFVYRSSGQVAETFNIKQRGFLREGYFADVAILNLDDFRALASYKDPEKLTTGVDYLFVNGAAVIVDGQRQDALPGVIIKHEAVTSAQ